MRRRQLLLLLGAGMAGLAATIGSRGSGGAGAPLRLPQAARIRQELGAERCRALLAEAESAADGRVELTARVEADLRAARILFVASQPFTHSELAAALRGGA